MWYNGTGKIIVLYILIFGKKGSSWTLMTSFKCGTMEQENI
jgi:hypothetical protein